MEQKTVFQKLRLKQGATRAHAPQLVHTRRGRGRRARKAAHGAMEEQLQDAARDGDTDKVQRLIKKGTSVNCTDKVRCSPLRAERRVSVCVQCGVNAHQ